MTRYRLVFSDMDETFLDDDHRIPDANVRALERLSELGVRFVPCSGRPYASIMQNFAEIDQRLLAGSFVIGFNGGSINRYGEDEPLASCGLDDAVASHLLEQGLSRGLCVHIYLEDGAIIVIDAPARERETVGGVTGLSFADPEPGARLRDYAPSGRIAKMIYMSEDFGRLRELGDELSGDLAARGVGVSYSSNRYLELMPAGVDKGSGVRALAGMLGIPMEEVICVGDSLNDLPMIQAAGLGVGVANVTDDVRPACDVVLSRTGAQGAFEELVDRFFS